MVIGRSSSRIYVARFKTKRNSNPPVQEQEYSPCNTENDRIRQHHRNERSNTGIFNVSLTEYNH